MGATVLGLDSDRHVRWVRVAEQWVLAGPADLMITGRTVEVLRADGGVEETEVGDRLGVLSDGRTACAKATGPDPVRWVRFNGVWVVCGAGLVSGQVVEVRSASQALTRVRVGQIVDRRDGKVFARPDIPVERPVTVRPVAGRDYKRVVDGKVVRADRGRRGVYGKVFIDRTRRFERVRAAFDGGVTELAKPGRKASLSA